MKSLFTFITALLLAVVVSHADTHHELVIHGTLRVGVPGTSGTTAVTNIVSYPITNATLLKDVSTFISKPIKDLDIVIDDQTAEIDVIVKPATTSGTASVAGVIGNPQNANTASELHSTNPKKLGGYEVINTYGIFLPPGFPANYDFSDSPAITGLYLTLGHNKTDSNEFATVLSAQFSGGANEGESNAYIIEGNASTTSKSYVY